MTPVRAAVASNADVARVVAEALVKGNAVDAVVAGVFAAAALDASVLLGPVQMLLGGAGAGARAIDGRALQPGRGLPRPRGFRLEDPIPPAAWIATPVLPAALVAALPLAGGGSLSRALGPALDIARRASPERRDVLLRISRRGARAMCERPISEELVAAAGRGVGGLLTEADLEEASPASAACEAGGGELLVPPWRALDAVDASHVEVVVAADARGLVCVACYEAGRDGLAVEALGLVAPLLATPVRRGEQRERPGSRRPAAAPIALRSRGGMVDAAFGVANGATSAVRDAAASLDVPLMAGAADARIFAVLRSVDGVAGVRVARR
jgi:gamma-glutamyltranspeptidase/glutathione hydrolase